MISKAHVFVEIARHRRLRWPPARSRRALTHKLIANGIAKSGGRVDSPIYELAVKTGETGLRADEYRFNEACRALPLSEQRRLTAVMESVARALARLTGQPAFSQDTRAAANLAARRVQAAWK